MDIISKNVQNIDKKYATSAVWPKPKFDEAATRKLLDEINKELGGKPAKDEEEK